MAAAGYGVGSAEPIPPDATARSPATPGVTDSALPGTGREIRHRGRPVPRASRPVPPFLAIPPQSRYSQTAADTLSSGGPESPPLGERVAGIEAQLRALQETAEANGRAIASAIDELRAELGSHRDPKSIRGRLHVLEQDRAAVEIAREALARASQARRQSWSALEKAVALAIGLVGAFAACVGALAALGWV